MPRHVGSLLRSFVWESAARHQRRRGQPPCMHQSTHDPRSGATSIFVLRACRPLSRGLKRQDAEIGEERVTSPTAPRTGRQRHVRVQTVGLVPHLSQTHLFVSPTSCSRPQEEDVGKALLSGVREGDGCAVLVRDSASHVCARRRTATNVTPSQVNLINYLAIVNIN